MNPIKQNDINMIIYGILALMVTLFFDVFLKGGEHELENGERIVIFLLWPIMMIWFFYHIIKEYKNRNNEQL